VVCKLIRHPNHEVEILEKLKGKNFTIRLLNYFGVDILPFDYGLVFPFYQYTCAIHPSPVIIPIIMQRLFQAIKYCHANNIIHRDVKPSNILLSDKSCNPDVVLADFGLSCFYKHIKLKEVCGTEGHMAPEMLLHQTYDLKVDIWSAGTVFYELLTKRQPFADYNYDDLCTMFQDWKTQKAYVLKLNSLSLSKNEKNLLSLLLRRSPNMRPTADVLLKHTYFQNVK